MIYTTWTLSSIVHYGKWVFSLDTKIIVFVTKVGTLTTGYVLRYTYVYVDGKTFISTTVLDFGRDTSACKKMTLPNFMWKISIKNPYELREKIHQILGKV